MCVSPSKGENMKHSFIFNEWRWAKKCCSVHRRYSRGLSTCSWRSVISLTTVCVWQVCILVSVQIIVHPTETLIICVEGIRGRGSEKHMARA